MTIVTRFPISVIVERRPPGDGRWATEQWGVIGAIGGEAREAGVHLIRNDGSTHQYLHTGFHLELFRDDTESYRANLMAATPSVFVICGAADDDEDDDAHRPGLTPILVTVSYGEASSYMEVENPVFSVPMPPEVYLWVERYVVENHVPQEMKKRRRRNWTDEAQQHGRHS